jgi:hypothetical protein
VEHVLGLLPREEDVAWFKILQVVNKSMVAGLLCE